MKAAVNLRRFRKIDFYRPYPKQQEFHDLGATKRERLLMAGNRQGKTYAGAAEMAMHLTGLYPAWWKGRRWAKPVTAWVAGESSILVRNTPQSLLCGKYGVEADKGTGLIPKECLKDFSLARGVTDAYDTVQVEHRTNGAVDGISTVSFKSYEQGRQKFQADEVDIIWDDEEPEMAIYQEELARISASDGMIYTTFTPLLGRSDVVLRFIQDISVDRAYVRMTIDDALHFTEEMKRKTIEGYASYEREARVKGIPLLGSGRIFECPEENIVEDTLSYIPEHWVKLWGIDFGIGHPFGAALILWDRDADVIHVHHAFRYHADSEAKELPILHAAQMKPIGIEVPVAWPQDGHARDKGSGEALAAQYKTAGLKMLHEHAKWPDGSNSTEVGVKEIQDREATGRLKYAKHLHDLLEERRYYHRKDGQIVKERDDILSALRVAIMMKRFAKPVMLGGKKSQRFPGQVAKGLDFDYF